MRIILRNEWGAAKPEGPQPWRRITIPTPEVFIHHTVTPVGPDVPAILRGFQKTHMRRAEEHGWQTWDIAYSHVIDTEGRIYEGRGWGFYGNHTQNHNHTAHAVAFLGDYRTRTPTTPSLDACRWLISEGRTLGYLSPARTLPTGGHRDVWPTACPGGRLYDRLDYLRQAWEEDLTDEQAKQLAAIHRILTTEVTDLWPSKLMPAVARIDARPPGTATVDEAQVEAIVRRVLAEKGWR